MLRSVALLSAIILLFQINPAIAQSITIVPLDAEKRVFVPTQDIGDDWRNIIQFDDSQWSLCQGSPGGVGYEKDSGYQSFISLDVSNRMYSGASNPNTTCYIRIKFDLSAEQFGSLENMRLNIRYDDGFVAYLNGNKVAEANAPESPEWNSNSVEAIESENFIEFNLPESMNYLVEGENLFAIHGLNTSITSSDFLILPSIQAEIRSGLFINEFMVNNVLSFANPDDDYEDWIEIYNASGADIDLAGYYLSDDIDPAKYYQIPAGQSSITTIPDGGYLIFYADENKEKGANHLDFKLDKNSERILLISKDGVTILDDISYNNQFRDISFGRSPNGSDDWVYFESITPGSANSQGYTNSLRAPLVDEPAGNYSGSVNIHMHPFSFSDIVRYTLDATDPVVGSTIYAAPIQVGQTSVVRARSFNDNAMPSEITSKMYFINQEHSLPVAALITNPPSLYDPETGLFNNDVEGRAWERFAELEYFKNGIVQFHAPAGIRIQGNTGPTVFDKKSFRVFFREGYGEGKLDYNLFPGNTITEFNKLVLRSGYDDSIEPTSDGVNTSGTLIRDPLVSYLWKNAGGFVSNSSLSVLYLNEIFFGIFDIKESVDEDFIKDHFSYNKVDVIRTRWDAVEVVSGNDEKWNELMNFFENNTFESDERVAEADAMIDLDDYISLQALMHATQYKSWAYGTSFFREKIENARWQMTIWDTDRSYTELNWNGFTEPYSPTGIYLDNTITKKLLVNTNFKNKFINRIADLLNTVFDPNNVISAIDSLAELIAPEIPAEAAKWGSTVEGWTENINSLRTFAQERSGIVRQQIQNYFNLAAQVSLTVDAEQGNGKILVNTISIQEFPWTGKYFSGVPITLTAIPEPGYKFAGWSDPDLPSEETVTLELNGDKTILAIFIQLASINAELIVPARIKSGQHLPVVVRVRDINWEINPVEQTPMQIGFSGAHTDTLIAIKRGAGSGIIRLESGMRSFNLSAQNFNVPVTEKQIMVGDLPIINYSGTLPTGQVIWDDTADWLLTGDVTVPEGCTLTIKHGTWVLITKYVRIFVYGKVIVEGTAGAPVVITSDNWSEPWGGFEFENAEADFQYCFVLNGAGDMSKGNPTNDGWHTGYQHLIFGKEDCEFNFDNCYFLNSLGKVFGIQDSKISVSNSFTAFVRHGGEFHRTLLNYNNSHLMNLPDDQNNYTEDIDTDGFHIDYVNPEYPEYSVIDRCYFVHGYDDAIDHHQSRLRISNCWLEDFEHEGVAASGGDTLRIFNTVSLNNGQGFEAGWTEDGITQGPILFIDHCSAVGNDVGLRIGDSYSWSYRNHMKVTNTVLYNNTDNIWNYLNSTGGPLEGALELSYSMLNDTEYDNSPHCITGVPQFNSLYYLVPGSLGTGAGTGGTNMGRADSSVVNAGAIVINEIMYNADGDANSEDWIELCNPQQVDFSISGFVIKDNDNLHTFELPENIIIPAGGFLVVCSDTAAFKLIYPEVNNFIGDITFGFGGADYVRVFSPLGELADSVAYDNKDPWPVEPDGDGYTLSLMDSMKDNSLPRYWVKSEELGGTPGRPNNIVGVDEEPTPELPTSYALEQNYPNPFNPSTTIEYSIPTVETPYMASLQHVTLEIYNILGQEIATLVNTVQKPGRYKVIFNAKGLSSGVYFYRIQAGKFVQTKKLVLLK
ncbi:MAG: CotH kinase family protein [bacterium]